MVAADVENGEARVRDGGVARLQIEDNAKITKELSQVRRTLSSTLIAPGQRTSWRTQRGVGTECVG